MLCSDVLSSCTRCLQRHNLIVSQLTLDALCPCCFSKTVCTCCKQCLSAQPLSPHLFLTHADEDGTELQSASLQSRPGLKPDSSSNILRRRQSFTYADSRLDPPVLPDSGWAPLGRPPGEAAPKQESSTRAGPAVPSAALGAAAAATAAHAAALATHKSAKGKALLQAASGQPSARAGLALPSARAAATQAKAKAGSGLAPTAAVEPLAKATAGLPLPASSASQPPTSTGSVKPAARAAQNQPVAVAAPRVQKAAQKAEAEVSVARTRSTVTAVKPSVSVQSKLLPESGSPHASPQSVRKAPVGMKGNANQDDSNHSLVEKYKAESAARKQMSLQQAGSISRTSGSVKSPLPSNQQPSSGKSAVALSSGKQPLPHGKLKTATELRVARAADRAATPMRADKADLTAQEKAPSVSQAKQPHNGSQNTSESDSE